MATSLGDALGSDDVDDRLDPMLLLPQGQSFTHMAVHYTGTGNFYWATLAQAKDVLLANTLPNQLPLVSLALSSQGIQLGDSTTLTATATDPDGTISSVTFFDGATALAALTTAPFVFVYTPASTGSRNIRVVAIDNDGASAQDSLPLVVVAGAPVVLPTPTITFPSIGNKAVGGLPSMLTASSTNTVTPITYASSNQAVLEVRLDPGGWVAEPLTAGTATVTAYQVAGNGYNAANPVAQSVTVTGTPVNPTFDRTLVANTSDNTLTWSGLDGWQLLYNSPVQTVGSAPGSPMLVFYPDMQTQVGQVDFDPLDAGKPCGFRDINGNVTYYHNGQGGALLTFVSGNILLAL